VRIIAKFMTVLLLLFVAGMPVMACMQPDTAMTSEEMACCKQMANDCGDMGDQSSGHDCCKKTTVRTDAAAVQPTTITFSIELFSLASLPTGATDHEQVGALLASMVHEYSPPESPPGFNQILRI
jgi:hypothetical protein